MQSQDKQYWFSLALSICLSCLCIAGCAAETGGPVALTPVATAVSPALTTSAGLTSTSLPMATFTPSPIPIILPAVTMSPQEAEEALQELLRTNGNCTSKCLAGIRPDEMTMQEAVDQMARWGMLSMREDKDGSTFVHALDIALYDKQVRVNLVLTLRNEAINAVYFHIPRREDSEFLDANVWLANRETWRAFQFDNLLKAYGTPSFVGFRLATWDPEGKLIVYTLDIHYEQLNLEIGIGGLAHRDGKNVIICPSKDTHSLGIDINPYPPLSERQQASPITWQALTDKDLQAFYQMFTDESISDGCVTTTLEKIIELDPYFG